MAEKTVDQIVNEILDATEENQFAVARQCRDIFYGKTEIALLEQELEERISEAKNPAVVYFIVDVLRLDEKSANMLLEAFLPANA